MLAIFVKVDEAGALGSRYYHSKFAGSSRKIVLLLHALEPARKQEKRAP